MIQVENLTYGFPTKELYKKVSFTLETGQHCAFIGGNGTGKTTLVDMIIHPENYLYDGKIIKSSECRIGYVNQFSKAEKDLNLSVFEYLSQCFVENQAETARICDEISASLAFSHVRFRRLLSSFIRSIKFTSSAVGTSLICSIISSICLTTSEMEDNAPPLQ